MHHRENCYLLRDNGHEEWENIIMTAKSEIVNVLSLARVFITVEKRMVGSIDLANLIFPQTGNIPC